MRCFLLSIIGAAAISACSEGRERRVLSIDSTLEQPDLTLPDTVTRQDTSVPVVTPKAEPKPARAARRPARTARAAPAPTPKVLAGDTGVQAYAPGQVRDTVTPEPDTSAVESASAAPADTVAISSDTTIASDTVASTSSDTATASPLETATPPVTSATASQPDTAAESRPASPPRDTTPANPPPAEMASAASPDTTTTPPTDTMVASPPAPPVTAAPSARELAARTLAAGTEIHAQLRDSITSRRDTVGQVVSAHVMQNVRGPDGRTLIPAGAQVRFTITRIRPSRSKNSQGRLGLRPDSIILSGGSTAVKAETRAVPRELRGRGVTPGDAAKVGGGAAAGAVIGGVVGGDTRGAVIGGVAGAAAGAVLATQTKTRDVVVKAKTPVVFVLTAPLVVAP